MMQLYDYYRSTACYRVRIALNLKGIPHEKTTIHLVNNGGEQHHADYQAINPQELVPALKIHDTILTQSIAILEYLEETHPDPALLPANPLARATVRSMALLIACDMHPLNNLRVLQQLKTQFDADESQIETWYHRWLKAGFDALELRLQTVGSGVYCYGETVSMADVCLVPQVYNAERFAFDMRAYPRICAVNTWCVGLPAFSQAVPEG